MFGKNIKNKDVKNIYYLLIIHQLKIKQHQKSTQDVQISS
jgi:hypothetical protein